MPKPIPLLNEDQWLFFKELEDEGKFARVMPVPAMRLEYWLKGRFKELLNQGTFGDYKTSGINRYVFNSMMTSMYRSSSILISLVMEDQASDTTFLALAICNDEFSLSILRKAGVFAMAWEDAKRLKDGPLALIKLAIKEIENETIGLKVGTHKEEVRLKYELENALNLRWRDGANKNIYDAELKNTIDKYILRQRQTFAVTRESAISKFIDIAGCSSLSDKEREMHDTSSADIVVHRLPPHNIPVLVVEYDGRLHWTDQKKMKNDKAKDELLAKSGVALLRIRANEAPARHAFDPITSGLIAIDPRLPPLLDIAREIVQGRSTQLERDAEYSIISQEKWQHIQEISHSIFGKNYFEISDEQRERVTDVSLLSGGWEFDDKPVEWAIDDYELKWQENLGWQLADAGVPEELIIEFDIVDTERGKIAKGRMKIPGSERIVPIETVGITLRAPTLSENEIERLLQKKLTAAFADEAKRYLNSLA